MKRGHSNVDERDLIDQEAASRFVLDIVEAWTDPCGEEFEVDADADVGSKQIRVRIGGIPEIHGFHLSKACNADNGKMCIASIEVDFVSKHIVFGVRRSSGRQSVDALLCAVGRSRRWNGASRACRSIRATPSGAAGWTRSSSGSTNPIKATL